MSFRMKHESVLEEKYLNLIQDNQQRMWLSCANEPFLKEMRRKVCEELRDILPKAEQEFEKKHFLEMAKDFASAKRFFDNYVLTKYEKFHSEKHLQMVKEENIFDHIIPNKSKYRKNVYGEQFFGYYQHMINKSLYEIIEGFCKMMLIDEADFIVHKKSYFDCNMENKFVIINSYLNPTIYDGSSSVTKFNDARYNPYWANNIDLIFNSNIPGKKTQFKRLSELVMWNVTNGYPIYKEIIYEHINYIQQYLRSLNLSCM